MNCPKCNSIVNSNDKFCGICGYNFNDQNTNQQMNEQLQTVVQQPMNNFINDEELINISKTMNLDKKDEYKKLIESCEKDGNEVLKNHFVIGKSLVKLLLNIYTHMNMCVYIHAYILLNCLNSQAMLDTY